MRNIIEYETTFNNNARFYDIYARAKAWLLSRVLHTKKYIIHKRLLLRPFPSFSEFINGTLDLIQNEIPEILTLTSVRRTFYLEKWQEIKTTKTLNDCLTLHSDDINFCTLDPF